QSVTGGWRCTSFSLLWEGSHNNTLKREHPTNAVFLLTLCCNLLNYLATNKGEIEEIWLKIEVLQQK
ncbi:MAG: hypothetical protein ACE5IR_04900, partial [bacterium]